jgi:hypothetical protein
MKRTLELGVIDLETTIADESKNLNRERTFRKHIEALVESSRTEAVCARRRLERTKLQILLAKVDLEETTAELAIVTAEVQRTEPRAMRDAAALEELRQSVCGMQRIADGVRRDRLAKLDKELVDIQQAICAKDGVLERLCAAQSWLEELEEREERRGMAMQDLESTRAETSHLLCEVNRIEELRKRQNR